MPVWWLVCHAIIYLRTHDGPFIGTRSWSWIMLESTSAPAWMRNKMHNIDAAANYVVCVDSCQDLHATARFNNFIIGYVDVRTMMAQILLLWATSDGFCRCVVAVALTVLNRHWQSARLAECAMFRRLHATVVSRRSCVTDSIQCFKT